MKKLILLLLIFPFFIGCSKDDNKDNTNTLDNTTRETYELDEKLDMEYKSTITFGSFTFSYVGYERIGSKKDNFSGSGTYKYDHPRVTMTEGGENEVATISGNKLTAGEITYTKKNNFENRSKTLKRGQYP